jgi:ABC-2 type transport system permease protein
MRNVFLVAKREYLEKIRGRSFRISTILVPMLMIGAVGFSAFTGRKINTGMHIAIAADSAALAGDVRTELLRDKYAQYKVDVIAPATAQDRDAQLDRIKRKQLDGLLSIENSADGAPHVTFTTGTFGDLSRLTNAFNRGLVHERLTAAGMDAGRVDAATKYVSIEQLQVNNDGKTGRTAGAAPMIKAVIMAMLLLMPIMLYGMDMARSIVEEKASRVFEVMLAVVKPDDMLAGKLIGACGVGLTQIAIWATAASIFTVPAVAGSMLSGDFSIHFTWMDAVFFPVYFLFGFLLFSALFSGLAATCETSQDLQMFMPLVAIPVWISFGILPFLVKDPSSNAAVFGSLFPLTSPFVMVERVALQPPPLWQFGVSIGILILTLWAVVWFAARLYRIGILMYGKRATLPEILRWLRYS